MPQFEIASQDPVAGFNSVLPTKVYGIWGFKGQTDIKLDEVQAENVHEAFRQGRDKWGTAARCAIRILKGKS